MARLFPDNNFVPAKLGTGLRLVVAEAPGEEESIQLEPLVGGSGRRFDALSRAAGISRSTLTITNTICCRPPDNIYPTDSEARNYISESEADSAVAQCYKNHLVPILHARPWQRVDILGDKALLRLTGRSGIFSARGAVAPIKELGDKLIGIPTLHPAYVARDQVYSKVVVNDLSKGLQQAPEDYNLYPSLEDVQNFNATTFSFDIENLPHPPHTISVVGLSDRSYSAMCVPFRGTYITELKRIFAAAKAVIGQNSLQHDEPILKQQGVSINPDATHWDIMLMQHLLMPDLPHDLGFIGSIFVNKPAWKHLHAENEELYNCRDTDVQFQSWLQLLPLLRKEKLEELYLHTQVPLARICREMSQTGIRINPNRIHEIREKFGADIGRLERSLPEVLQSYSVTRNTRVAVPPGEVFLSERTGKPLKYRTVPVSEQETPWRSAARLKEYFYEEKHLPKQLHPKTQEVTIDKSALEKLQRKVANPRTTPGIEEAERAALGSTLSALRQLKKLDKILSSFATEQLARQEIIHTHFNVHGTASGRLSSSDPNLQQIPKAARFLYVPLSEGWEFLEVDYSGIENRLTAYLADDTERLDKFIRVPGYSEHKHAAEVFFGILYADVDKDSEEYAKAKRIVHGTNYGMGARKIANTYDMDEAEVRQLIAKWKAAIWRTTQWQESTAAQAKSEGFLRTPFGRKRWFYTDSYYTESLSFIPQSSAADVIFAAMIGLYYERINLCIESARLVAPYVEALPRPAMMHLQVHDSLIFSYPRDMRDSIVGCVARVTQQPWPQLGGFAIPIEAKVGPSWGEMERVNLN